MRGFHFMHRLIKLNGKITFGQLKKLRIVPTKTLCFFSTGKWCSPCRIMKREVFADKEVEKIVNSKVTPIIIDIDNPNTKKIVNKYKIGATPTTIIIDSNGEVLDYAVGKIDKKKFLEMINNSETK